MQFVFKTSFALLLTDVGEFLYLLLTFTQDSQRVRDILAGDELGHARVCACLHTFAIIHTVHRVDDADNEQLLEQVVAFSNSSSQDMI
jgi:hypothetical protein